MSLGGAIILIVDDTPLNLNLLFDALESTGAEVYVADGAAAARQSIAHNTPDIILLDVMMPGTDGFEFCRQLKADAENADIPVIFMTALSEPFDEVRGLQLGAVDYITKPIRVETTLARISTHLRIRRLQQELQQRNGELDAYARMVAHDLQNPVAAVLSTAKLIHRMAEHLAPADLRSYTDILLNASERASRLINETLTLASLRRDQVTTHVIDMGQIVGEARQELNRMIGEYNATVIVPEVWPSAVGYAPWVRMVWVNYMSNGMKYGGSPPRIELGAEPNPDGSVRFWVQDNGPGLSNADRERVFQEFTRLEEQRASGHGIGLAIVRRAVEKLGGSVGVDSETGVGSRFSFTLPAI